MKRKINDDTKLIKDAEEAIIKSRPVNLVDTGEVGCALITTKGNVFRGVSIGHYCGIGSCAEYQAIGSMITNGEKEIRMIVAVYYDKKSGKYEIVPPCGKCREMIKQTCKRNNNTEVIIGKNKKIKLRELLPHSWKGTIEK